MDVVIFVIIIIIINLWHISYMEIILYLEIKSQ